MNLLETREFKTSDRKCSFVETAGSTGERVALYSILLADLMGRSAEFQITEKDSVLIRNLLYYTQYLMLSQFTHSSAFSINHRRALLTDTVSQLGTAGVSDDPLPKVARDNTLLSEEEEELQM